MAHFHRQKLSPDGYRSRCKACRKAETRAYYEANAEALRKKSARFRREQPAAAKAHVARWKENNRVRKLAYDRQYHSEHREERLAYNRTPERREAHRANARTQKAKRRAAMGAAVGRITAKEWAEIRASYGGLCVYCHAKPARLTQDHVVALNRGGSHTADNVVPACRRCNRSKSDKPLLVFLAERAASFN